MIHSKPIILIAHGSRDPNWRKPFNRFMEAFSERFPDRQIRLCYMEICEPTLMDICNDFYQQNILSVVLVPMFMASGGHVDHDIPVQVDAVEQALLGFSIELTPPIGEQALVVQAMQESLVKL